MAALKYTHLIKEKVGHHAHVYDFYIDMRCFGEGYEEFYRRCQEEGTHFIRGKVAEITDRALIPAEKGKLIAIAEDTLLGKCIRVPVDMVVLCSAIEARKDALSVGRIFGVNLGADGFFLEEHPKLGPLNTATEGVFIAGACQSPKDIPDTVAQASGAAAKALSLASRGRVTVQSVISWMILIFARGVSSVFRFVLTRPLNLTIAEAYRSSMKPSARDAEAVQEPVPAARPRFGISEKSICSPNLKE